MNVLHYRRFNNFAKGLQGRHFYLNPLELFPSCIWHMYIVHAWAYDYGWWTQGESNMSGGFYCSLVDFYRIIYSSIIYTHLHGISQSSSHTFSISNSTNWVNLFPILVMVPTPSIYVMDGHSKGKRYSAWVHKSTNILRSLVFSHLNTN
jgi:hypothetical protein